MRVLCHYDVAVMVYACVCKDHAIASLNVHVCFDPVTFAIDVAAGAHELQSWQIWRSAQNSHYEHLKISVLHVLTDKCKKCFARVICNILVIARWEAKFCEATSTL